MFLKDWCRYIGDLDMDYLNKALIQKRQFHIHRDSRVFNSQPAAVLEWKLYPMWVLYLKSSIIQPLFVSVPNKV